MKKIDSVIKVGGSCLRGKEDIQKLHDLLYEFKDKHIVLVVSAFKNITNLIEKWYDNCDVNALQEILRIHRNIFESLLPENHFLLDFPEFEELKNIHINKVERDEALALGEKMSSAIILSYLKQEGIDIIQDIRDPFIFGNPEKFFFDKSREEILRFVESRKSQHILTQGFASWDEGNKSNLGREGSDLTAVLWARALCVDCVLYKDVGVLYTADPRKYRDVKKIEKISFSEYQRDFFGAGIVYDKVIDFCLVYDQSLYIYSFENNTCGTKFFAK